MSTIRWTTPAPLVDYLSNDLNALANAARVNGVSIDNEAGQNLYMTVELHVNTQGAARSAGAYVSIYLLPTIDGVNYSYGTAGTTPSPISLVATLSLDASLTARYVLSQPIPIPPHPFIISVENNTGQAFAAASNTLKYRVFNMQTV